MAWGITQQPGRCPSPVYTGLLNERRLWIHHILQFKHDTRCALLKVYLGTSLSFHVSTFHLERTRKKWWEEVTKEDGHRGARLGKSYSPRKQPPKRSVDSDDDDSPMRQVLNVTLDVPRYSTNFKVSKSRLERVHSQ